MPDEAPATVSWYVPGDTVPATFTVSVARSPVTDGGAKSPVIPAGGFTNANETPLVKLVRLIWIVEAADAPWWAKMANGLATIVNAGLALTTTEYEADADATPGAVALTVPV